MAHSLITGAVNPQKLRQAIGLTDEEEKFALINEALYRGNHWLDGRGYIGAPPDPLDKHAAELWARLRRSFTSRNVTKEIVDRQVSAILGNVPDYGFTVRRFLRQVPKQVPDPAFVPDPLKPGEKAPLIPDPKGATVPEQPSREEIGLIEEAKAAMEVFYSKRKPVKWLKKMFRRRLTGGRAYLRLYVPPKYRTSGNGRFPLAKDLNEAVERIFISSPEASDCKREVDEETQDELFIFNYKRATATQIFEVVFLDDDGKTIIATIEQTPSVGITSTGAFALLNPAPASVVAAAEESQKPLDGIPEDQISVPLDLNGNLTQFEAQGEPLVTEQIRTNNFSCNLNLTMSNHVTVESGFRELSVTNVEMETERVADSNAPGGFRDVPKKLKRGAGIVHNFVGIAFEDNQGNETLTTPGVHAFDPVPITNFDAGQQMFRRNCLDEAHQTYALITGDATASGESRIQALADFVMFSLDYKEEIDDAGTWLFETVLFWASVLMGKPGRFNGLRANFQSKIYVGKLSPNERTALMSEVAARLRSREGYMTIVGDIADPAEEMTRIDNEQNSSVDGQRAVISLAADRLALGLNNPGDGGGGASGGSGGGGQ